MAGSNVIKIVAGGLYHHGLYNKEFFAKYEDTHKAGSLVLSEDFSLPNSAEIINGEWIKDSKIISSEFGLEPRVLTKKGKLEYTFTGNNIALRMEVASGWGTAEVRINGGKPSMVIGATTAVDTISFDAVTSERKDLLIVDGLPDGQHTLTLYFNNEESGINPKWCAVNGFIVYGTSDDTVSKDGWVIRSEEDVVPNHNQGTIYMTNGSEYEVVNLEVTTSPDSDLAVLNDDLTPFTSKTSNQLLNNGSSFEVVFRPRILATDREGKRTLTLLISWQERPLITPAAPMVDKQVSISYEYNLQYVPPFDLENVRVEDGKVTWDPIDPNRVNLNIPRDNRGIQTVAEYWRYPAQIIQLSSEQPKLGNDYDLVVFNTKNHSYDDVKEWQRLGIINLGMVPFGGEEGDDPTTVDWYVKLADSLVPRVLHERTLLTETLTYTDESLVSGYKYDRGVTVTDAPLDIGHTPIVKKADGSYFYNVGSEVKVDYEKGKITFHLPDGGTNLPSEGDSITVTYYKRGFNADGLVMDGLDKNDQYPENSFNNTLVENSTKLKARYPNKLFACRGGFDLLDSLVPLCDYVVYDSCFSDYDSETGSYFKVPNDANKAAVQQKLNDKRVSHSFEVLSLDYCPESSALEVESAEYTRTKGYIGSTVSIDSSSPKPIIEVLTPYAPVTTNSWVKFREHKLGNH